MIVTMQVSEQLVRKCEVFCVSGREEYVIRVNESGLDFAVKLIWLTTMHNISWELPIRIASSCSRTTNYYKGKLRMRLTTTYIVLILTFLSIDGRFEIESYLKASF